MGLIDTSSYINYKYRCKLYKKKRSLYKDFIRIHIQKLTPTGTGHILRHGRFFINMKNPFSSHEFEFKHEWHVGGDHCSIGCTIGGGEEDLRFNVCIPKIINLYFGIDGIFPKRFREWFRKQSLYDGLTTNLRIFSWYIWFTFLNDDMGYCDNLRFKNSHSFNVHDFIFGERKINCKLLAEYDINIPMPEKDYPAKAKIERITHKYKRFKKSQIFERINIEILDPDGIPHPGKGTTSYNWGEDALFSISTPFTTIKSAIQNCVDNVLDMRRRYPL